MCNKVHAAWGAESTPDILDILDDYDVTTTFFVTGFWLENYPEKAKEIVERGHELENHSLTHPHMTNLEKDQIIDEAEPGDIILFHNNGSYTPDAVETILEKLIVQEEFEVVPISELIYKKNYEVDPNTGEQRKMSNENYSNITKYLQPRFYISKLITAL